MWPRFSSLIPGCRWSSAWPTSSSSWWAAAGQAKITLATHCIILATNLANTLPLPLHHSGHYIITSFWPLHYHITLAPTSLWSLHHYGHYITLATTPLWSLHHSGHYTTLVTTSLRPLHHSVLNRWEWWGTCWWCWWSAWRATCRPPPTCTSSTWQWQTCSCVWVRTNTADQANFTVGLGWDWAKIITGLERPVCSYSQVWVSFKDFCKKTVGHRFLQNCLLYDQS